MRKENQMPSFEAIKSGLWSILKTYLVDPIRDIGVKDIIDILLLSLVLFFIYRLIRNSRAWKLLVGLLVLFFASIVADVFGLSGLSFVFGNFQELGILAVLILFQPEFRMALEKVGGTPITGIKSISAETRDVATINAEIDALCTAAADLSREKVGALIVLERTTKLGEYINSGVYVDAAISPHILRNLFFNKAPLHDGAVIIRGSRICAAGCFLPLSTKEDINKDLGTRHRAAIGMTEVSDAVVIVVSEETGTISLSVSGSLTRNYNYSTLKQALTSYLITSSLIDGGKHAMSKKRRVKKK